MASSRSPKALDFIAMPDVEVAFAEAKYRDALTILSSWLGLAFIFLAIG
jgi:hypothetical protein